MTVFAMLNIDSGQVEKPQSNVTSITTEVYSVALPTSLANGDTMLGPIVPAGAYIRDCVLATDSLDSSTGITLEVGWSGTPAGLITSAANGGQGGGVARMNVAAALGKVFTTDTQIIVTVTHAATTAVAGTLRLAIDYTNSP